MRIYTAVVIGMLLGLGTGLVSMRKAEAMSHASSCIRLSYWCANDCNGYRDASPLQALRWFFLGSSVELGLFLLLVPSGSYLNISHANGLLEGFRVNPQVLRTLGS